MGEFSYDYFVVIIHDYLKRNSENVCIAHLCHMCKKHPRDHGKNIAGMFIKKILTKVLRNTPWIFMENT